MSGCCSSETSPGDRPGDRWQPGRRMPYESHGVFTRGRYATHLRTTMRTFRRSLFSVATLSAALSLGTGTALAAGSSGGSSGGGGHHHRARGGSSGGGGFFGHHGGGGSSGGGGFGHHGGGSSGGGGFFGHHG